MISRIARKELTEMLRDGRFRLLAGMVLAISVLSLAAGWKTYSDLSRQHAAAQAETRAQWLGQDKKNPHSAAHYGMYAFKPKSQLAMVDTGIDPYMGVAVWLEAHKQNDFKFRPAQDRTAVQRFGEMTGAEVLQVLLPLFIVLMTFAAFAGEREQGTLRQLLSLGVSRRDLVMGKALGVAVALALVLVPSTVLAVAALALFGRERIGIRRPCAWCAAWCRLLDVLRTADCGIAGRIGPSPFITAGTGGATVLLVCQQPGGEPRCVGSCRLVVSHPVGDRVPEGDGRRSQQ